MSSFGVTISKEKMDFLKVNDLAGGILISFQTLQQKSFFATNIPRRFEILSLNVVFSDKIFISSPKNKRQIIQRRKFSIVANNCREKFGAKKKSWRQQEVNFLRRNCYLATYYFRREITYRIFNLKHFATKISCRRIHEKKNLRRNNFVAEYLNFGVGADHSSLFIFEQGRRNEIT